MRPVPYLNPITEYYFQTLISIGFKVIHENLSVVPEYPWPHASYLLLNTKRSSTQWKALSNWLKITTVCFHTSCHPLNPFLSFWVKRESILKKGGHLTPVHFCIWLLSFENTFYNASVLKHRKRKVFHHEGDVMIKAILQNTKTLLCWTADRPCPYGSFPRHSDKRSGAN